MPKPVQDFIPIEEIRDGVVILKSGQMRAILLASSVNFELKSSDEQEAIIMQYQNFLNSLDFPIQLFIQSRKLDIRPYITLLESRLKEQLNDLIKIQTREYIEFIKNVTDETNVMTKSFFVVVPFVPSMFGGKSESGESKGILASLFGKKKTGIEAGKQKMADFEESRSQLEQRKSIVVQGLSRIGIRTVSLGTEELVELFYKIFNPGDQNVPIIEK
ncbi:MAG TPA: hypothetical protein VJJ22_04860 [Candidatus Paceibacterota bacterium]